MEKEKQENELIVEILEAKFLGELLTAIRLFKEEWEDERHQGKVGSPIFNNGVWQVETSRVK